MSPKVYLPHIVRPGEFLAKLAFQYQFDATEVWEHAKNEALRKARPDPDLLSPGDLIFFPRGAPRQGTLAVGAENEVVLDVPQIHVHVKFQDEEGPWRNEPFTVAELEPERQRTTDGNGEIDLEVPLLTPSLTLNFPGRDHQESLLIGDLDPPATLSGVRQRLDGLGFLDPETPDETGDGLAMAIVRFQQAQGFTPTGRLDQATVDALAEAFGR
jgi:hypothetical protein